MPVLHNPKWERFAQNIAAGMSNGDAYEKAGFSRSRSNSSLLRRKKSVAERIAELTERRVVRDEAANAQAVRRTAITKVRVAEELAKLAFASMADFTKVGENGELITDLRNVTRDQLAAVQEVSYEVVRGKDGEQISVQKVRFKLSPKRDALMSLAQLFGWIIEKQEQGPPGAFDEMDDKQLEEQLVRRLADRGLDEGRARALIRARVVSGGKG